MSLVTESLEKRRDELAEQQAAKEDKPKIGPSGNKISMESVGSIEKAYNADRVAPTSSITGKGYNLLTSRLWSAMYTPRGSIIDFTGLYGAIRQYTVGQTSFTVVTEDSKTRLAKKFAEKSSGSFSYGWFSASFSQSYEQSSDVTEEKAFSKIWVEYIGMLEEISTNEWKSHLNPVFWEDLNNKAVSPKTLFDNYGTHLILRGYYGGNMDLLGTTHKKVTDTAKKIEASVSVSVKAGTAEAMKNSNVKNGSDGNTITINTQNGEIKVALGGQGGGQGGSQGGFKSGSVSASTSYEESSSECKYDVQIDGKCTGGTGAIPGSLKDFASVATSWLESLKDDKNWRFCGVPAGSGALFPIWDLAEKKDRHDELQAYFEEEMLKSQNLLVQEETYITDIKIVWGKKQEDAEIVASAWKRENYVFDMQREHDLNYHAGDGTGYIFIGYKRETRAQMLKNGHKPITNLFILDFGKSTSAYVNNAAAIAKLKKQVGATVKLDGYSDVAFNFVGENLSNKHGLRYEDIVNLNTEASGVRVLGYTTDPRFTPLTALGVYNQSKGEFRTYHESGEWIDIPSRGPASYEPRCSTNFKKDEGVYLVFKRAEELFDPTPSEN